MIACRNLAHVVCTIVMVLLLPAAAAAQLFVLPLGAAQNAAQNAAWNAT